MSTKRSSPVRCAPGPTSSPVFSAPKVTVTSASTASAPTSPVSRIDPGRHVDSHGQCVGRRRGCRSQRHRGVAQAAVPADADDAVEHQVGVAQRLDPRFGEHAARALQRVAAAFVRARRVEQQCA